MDRNECLERMQVLLCTGVRYHQTPWLLFALQYGNFTLNPDLGKSGWNLKGVYIELGLGAVFPAVGGTQGC